MKISMLSLLTLAIALFTIKLQATAHPIHYCSYPGAHFNSISSIPARKSSTNNLVLNQVHIIHRHGSRLPLSPSYSSCFNSLNIKSPQFQCDLTDSYQTFNNKDEISDEIFKYYDASTFRLEFQPRCATGQLTSPALEQFETLGKSIYDAYFAEESPFYSHFSELGKSSYPELVYFRSTDTERTRVSGALLITNIFRSIGSDSIVAHLTEEYIDSMRGKLDKLIPNKITTVNPSFPPKNEEAYNYIKTLTGKYSDSFFFNNTLFDSKFLDCYTTLLCSGMEEYLPAELRFNNDTNIVDNLGYKIFKTIEEETSFVYQDNNAAISRLNIHNFMIDFLNGMNLSNSIPLNPFYSKQKLSKLLVYSTHDSTLMMFLSWLGVFDNEWPPYAAAIILELYNDNNDQSFFRLIYKGQDITHKVMGCSGASIYNTEGVCPVKNIISLIPSFESIFPTPREKFFEPKIFTIYSGSIHDILFGIILGALLGLFMIFLFPFIKKHVRFSRERRFPTSNNSSVSY